MSNVDFNRLVINIAEAKQFVESESDPVRKALLDYFLQVPLLRMLHTDGEMSTEEYVAQLPKASFDMLFYVTTINRILQKPDILRKVLDGNLDALDMG
jgi:hypothetical protein